jgi:hypothetical protein
MWRRRLVVPAALLFVALAVSCSWSLAAAGGAPADGAKPFTWIAVADHFDQPAEGLVEHMVAAKPAFVVGVGDLVFRSSPDDYASLKRAVLDPLARVGARLYPVAGNHDFPVQPHWSEFWQPPATADVAAAPGTLRGQDDSLDSRMTGSFW